MTFLFEDILFHEDKLSIHAEFKPRGGLALGAWLQAGSQVDFDNARLGDEVRLEPFLQWNVSRQLLLRYSGAFVELDTRDGQQIFDARVHDLRLTWQFSVRSFLRLTAQFSTWNETWRPMSSQRTGKRAMWATSCCIPTS